MSVLIKAVNANNLEMSLKNAGSIMVTSTLSIIGSAIENDRPFRVCGTISLHNLQSSDSILIIEEIKDYEGTYREYARNTYSGIQTSPIVFFSPKICRGWRIKAQRTAGSDRLINYLFYREAYILPEPM